MSVIQDMSDRCFIYGDHKHQEYQEFLREYEALGHMSEIPNDSREGCYLPHHPVTKSDSVTTKVRVVFDASARSSSGHSLNELLMIGPTIQDDLCSLLLRFRTYKYVLAADIAKMYRQINIHPNDRSHQKILWREDMNKPIRTYQLNTVTYGTASAPYLAIRTLHQLAQDEESNYPMAAQTLTQDFYVDDLLTGENSLEKARSLRDQLIDITRKGGFELRQWISNEPQLLEPLRRKSDQSNHLSLDDKGTKKTLGLQWTATQDTLGYSSSQTTKARKVTKRTILAGVAQLFDPLGLVGPVVVQAKLILQALWKGHVEWDEAVPRDIHAAWVSFQSQLQKIHRITIPRRVTIDNTVDVQLHGFADASERAYGACIYIRSTDTTNRHQTYLLCSKSRIAPLKTQTLPRLELCAAVLLVKLVRSVTKALNLTFQKIVLWSDSTIVLHWINTPPHSLKTFVANRVTKILQGSTEKQWRHVPSEDNAADILSRGVELDDLIHHKTWYKGPQWLHQSEDAWPRDELKPIEVPEQRRVITLQTSIPTDFRILERFSSLPLLTRVVAYSLRSSNNTRRHPRRGGQLTIEELNQATRRIIRLLQETAFPNERQDIRAKSTPSKSNRLIALNPFLDAEGIIRVGGRLAQSELRYEQKHPAVLPQQHHITNLIIRETHIRQGHSGVQETLHAVRQAYWPINGRVAVKAAIRKCVTCHRMQARAPQYAIGQLPAYRVKFERPFLVVGIDYCGPLFIKEKRYRNTKKLKTYAGLFVCFSTKAVHIELVSDLTSAFLAALRRFVARRGQCTDINSDNAATFTGANNELHKTIKTITSETNIQLRNDLLNHSVRWHFIPPRTPHFGGLWEAAVKALKHHLTRVMKDTLFTYEELSTCMIEIEAILNSRPLTPLSSDPNDLSPLTPGHFLIGESLTSTPERDLTVLKPGRLSSWQRIQQIRQHLWNRWSKEYVNQLIVGKTWHKPESIELKQDMLVLLKEDNTHPLQWPMGRITGLQPGTDGITRVVTVRTNTGEYKRGVNKIASLPIDETETEEKEEQPQKR